jgi:hypothetical protein
MAGRGVLFAIDDDELASLGDAKNDAEVQALVNGIEARWEQACELDKAWDGIHRALTDGRFHRNASGPLMVPGAILGGTLLVESEEAIIVVKAADEVHQIASALASWDRGRFRSGFYRINQDEYGDLEEEDFEYCYVWFERMRAFFVEAAQEERAVVFSVDL